MKINGKILGHRNNYLLFHFRGTNGRTKNEWSQELQAGLVQCVWKYMSINKLLCQYFSMNNNISKLLATATALAQISWESTTCCSAALVGLKSQQNSTCFSRGLMAEVAPTTEQLFCALCCWCQHPHWPPKQRSQQHLHDSHTHRRPSILQANKDINKGREFAFVFKSYLLHGKSPFLYHWEENFLQ